MKFYQVCEEYKKLYDVAKEALKNSYAPYSKFQVGAAILTETGEIFTGCNVENASYGACICAERTAACKGISEGFQNFKAIAVVAQEKGEFKEAWPCGICRQFLFEFNKDIDVITGASKENLKCVKLRDLLSMGFSLDEK